MERQNHRMLPLKHLLATESCQVHSEDVYYGHLVLRSMGCFVLFYTSRVICQGALTMEEIIFRAYHGYHYLFDKLIKRFAEYDGILWGIRLEGI